MSLREKTGRVQRSLGPRMILEEIVVEDVGRRFVVVAAVVVGRGGLSMGPGRLRCRSLAFAFCMLGWRDS